MRLINSERRVERAATDVPAGQGGVRLSVWLSLTCLVVLLPMIAFSGFMLHQFMAEQRRVGSQMLERRSANAAMAVARELDDVCTELTALALVDKHGAVPSTNRAELARHLVQADPRLESIVLDGPFGRTRWASSAESASTPAPPHIDGSASPQAGARCEVSGYIGSATGTPPLVNVLRTRTPSGGEGVISATVRLDILEARFNQLRWPAEWTAAVIDQNGTILARSRDSARYRGQPSTPGLLEALRGTGDTFHSVTKDGVAAVTRGAPVPGTGWYVVVGQPASVLDAQVRRPILEMVASAVVCLLIGIAAAIYTARSVAAQLRRVVDAQLQGRSSPPSSAAIREIRQVAHALETARTALSASFSEIEAAREQALAQLRERDEMLDVLAHEVRQPLNNASAALQQARTLILRNVGPEAAAPLSRANGVLSAVTGSIDNTLAAAELLVAGTRLQRLDVDIDTLVAVAIADLSTEQATRVRVERTTPARTASMDPNLVRLALRNLLSNALKFSPADRAVTIRISDSEQPLALVFDVIDSGPGIDPEMLPLLFKRGGRHAANLGGRRQGLGLYIVDRVAQLHRGSVHLLHNGTDGATFRLALVQSFED